MKLKLTSFLLAFNNSELLKWAEWGNGFNTITGSGLIFSSLPENEHSFFGIMGND